MRLPALRAQGDDDIITATDKARPWRLAAALAVSVSDAAAVGETVTVQATRTVNVTDSATVADTPAQMAAALAVSVTDSAAVGESINAIIATVGMFYVNVADAVSVTERSGRRFAWLAYQSVTAQK